MTRPKAYLASPAARARARERFPGAPENYSMPDRLRGRPAVKLTLPREVREMLAQLSDAAGASKSEVVERLIREAAQKKK